MRRGLALCLLAALANAALWAPSSAAQEPLDIELQEGVLYDRVPGARSTYRDGKIEVLEFFWYGCPHCFEMLSAHIQWEKTKADDVSFEALALGGSSPQWVRDARTYYAARALGLPESFHKEFFLARHSDSHGKRPTSEKDIAAFFVESYGKKHDFDSQDFIDVMNSFAVVGRAESVLNRAESFGVTSVPEVVVDGRFRITRTSAGSYSAVFDVVDQLLELVRRDVAAKAKAQEKARARAKAKKAKSAAKKDTAGDKPAGK